MRPWFERQTLPFRTIAGARTRPNLLRQDRKALYDQAAVFATRESQLTAEPGRDVQRQSDAAVRAAHLAADPSRPQPPEEAVARTAAVRAFG